MGPESLIKPEKGIGNTSLRRQAQSASGVAVPLRSFRFIMKYSAPLFQNSLGLVLNMEGQVVFKTFDLALPMQLYTETHTR